MQCQQGNDSGRVEVSKTPKVQPLIKGDNPQQRKEYDYDKKGGARDK
jgi:hypothetical protein